MEDLVAEKGLQDLLAVDAIGCVMTGEKLRLFFQSRNWSLGCGINAFRPALVFDSVYAVTDQAKSAGVEAGLCLICYIGQHRIERLPVHSIDGRSQDSDSETRVKMS